jgi:hypothetical protein
VNISPPGGFFVPGILRLKGVAAVTHCLSKFCGRHWSDSHLPKVAEDFNGNERSYFEKNDSFGILKELKDLTWFERNKKREFCNK